MLGNLLNCPKGRSVYTMLIAEKICENRQMEYTSTAQTAPQNCTEQTTNGQAVIEWPTLIIIAVCVAALPLSTYFSSSLSLWLSVPILALVIALHSSLQHEALHGHPFRNAILNELLVFVPAGLFIPYRRFRDTHLQHHIDPNLTDPYDDPESNFLDPDVWAQFGLFRRTLYYFNNTLAGRMIVGPAIGLASFYKSDFCLGIKGDRAVILAYGLHFIGFIPLGIWLASFSTMPVWAYIISAYGGMSILKIRTFLEHRSYQKVQGRTVIIEDRGPLALLFLNNNFHFVHHDQPKVAWYRLPTLYYSRKDEFLQCNEGYTYPNYLIIFRKYFFRVKDPVPHPLWPFPKHGK